MKLASGDSLHSEHLVKVSINVGARKGEAPRDVAHLALALMAELSACLQMITIDIAHATDLDVARKRWLQRLLALVAMIEQSSETRETRITGQDRPLTVIRSALPEPSDAHPSKLTVREREVMELTRKGYPPRRIARHLQLSVKTVYTHLRNIRQKQRVLHPHQSD